MCFGKHENPLQRALLRSVKRIRDRSPAWVRIVSCKAQRPKTTTPLRHYSSFKNVGWGCQLNRRERCASMRLRLKLVLFELRIRHVIVDIATIFRTASLSRTQKQCCTELISYSWCLGQPGLVEPCLGEVCLREPVSWVPYTTTSRSIDSTLLVSLVFVSGPCDAVALSFRLKEHKMHL